MAKFGDLISVNKPVLIDFYTQFNQPQNVLKTLREVAVALGNVAKVIKIDMKQNELLAGALRIKENPTFIIYKNGEMKWRKTGVQDAKTLIETVKQYL